MQKSDVRTVASPSMWQRPIGVLQQSLQSQQDQEKEFHEPAYGLTYVHLPSSGTRDRTNLTCLPYIFVSVFSTSCTYAHICRASPVNLTSFTASLPCRCQVSNQSHPHNHLHAYFHFVPHQIYLYAHFIYSRVCGIIHFNNILYCKKVSFATLLYLYIRTRKQSSHWTVLLTNSYQVSKAVFVLIKDFASILNLLSSTTRMNLNLLPSLTK